MTPYVHGAQHASESRGKIVAEPVESRSVAVSLYRCTVRFGP